MARDTTAAYDSANDAAHFDEVIFAELQFSSGTSYVCTREHDVDWNSITWAGKGQVGTIEPIEEAGELDPLGIAMTLKVSAELLALALDPSEYKNRTAKVWRGLFGPDMVDLDWAGDPDGATALFEGMGGTITRSGATATRVNESGLIETVAADTLRIGYDPVTLECLGLLIEEARTNLCLRSQEFNTSWITTAASVSANTDTAPDGTTTAETLTASASVSGAIYQAFTLTAGATYAVSIFMKQGTATRSGIGLYDVTAGGWQGLLDVDWTAGVPSTSGTIGTVNNIKYEDYGSGWYRVSFTVSADAVNTSHRVYIYGDRAAGTNNTKVWGAQLEAGDSVTSYIPTTTATVARNRDAIKDSDISSFFNSSEGTMYVEATAVEPAANIGGGAAVTAEFHDGTTDERLMVYRNPSSVAIAYNKTGGVADVQRQAGAWADGATVRAAYAFKTNDFAISLDGAAVATDTVGTLATVSQLQFGASASNTQMLMGYLRRFTYYPHRLGNDVLEALSAGELDPAAAARGRKIVADPVGPFTFRMDSLEFELGRTGTLRLTAEGRLADWQRPRVRYYNDADQQAEYPGDNFFANTEEFVEKTLIW
jgi:hypothetical protein